MKPGTQRLLIGMAGAITGGIVGYFAFLWLARRGYYAFLLPGASVGVGGSLFVRDRSVTRATLCGILALVLGVFSEWRLAPFIADDSLGYFLAHLHKLPPLTLVMIIGGAAFGYWFSLGKDRTAIPNGNVPPSPT